MRHIALIILAACLLIGCSQQPAPASANPQPENHTLTWQVYDGTGDPATAVYVLDNEQIGVGQAGLEALRQRIARMPRDSKLFVHPYYGDQGDSVKRSYPFGESDLVNFTASHGIHLQIPSAG